MKRILVSIALFLSGVLVGGATLWLVSPRLAQLPGFRPPYMPMGEAPDSHQRERWRSKFEERLAKDLGLTEEQKKQIFPILARHSTEMDAIKAESFQRIRDVLERSRSHVDSLLTPEQRKRFQEQAARMPHPPFMSNRMGPFPGHRGMEGMPPPPHGDRGGMPSPLDGGPNGPPPPLR